MFPEQLADLRKRQYITQTELAARLGVARNTVSRWESGSTSPSPQMMVELVRFFGVSADYLLGLDDRGEVKYVEVLGLSEEQKALVKGITDNLRGQT